MRYEYFHKFQQLPRCQDLNINSWLLTRRLKTGYTTVPHAMLKYVSSMTHCYHCVNKPIALDQLEVISNQSSLFNFTLTQITVYLILCRHLQIWMLDENQQDFSKKEYKFTYSTWINAFMYYKFNEYPSMFAMFGGITKFLQPTKTRCWILFYVMSQ